MVVHKVEIHYKHEGLIQLLQNAEQEKIETHQNTQTQESKPFQEWNLEIAKCFFAVIAIILIVKGVFIYYSLILHDLHDLHCHLYQKQRLQFFVDIQVWLQQQLLIIGLHFTAITNRMVIQT